MFPCGKDYFRRILENAFKKESYVSWKQGKKVNVAVAFYYNKDCSESSPNPSLLPTYQTSLCLWEKGCASTAGQRWATHTIPSGLCTCEVPHCPSLLVKKMGHLKSQSTAGGGIGRGSFQTHWERFWDCYMRSGRVFGAWGKLCSVVKWFAVCVFWKMLLVFNSSLQMLLHSPEMSWLSKKAA